MRIERYQAYKASRVEWLCEVPEHWEFKRIKEVGTIKYGLSQPPKYLEEGLPLIRATNIEKGKIVDKGLVFISRDDVPYERNPVLNENDILIVRSGAYTADSAIISRKYHGAIAGFDMVLRPYKIQPKYLSYTLLSNYVLKDQLILSSFRAAQPHLNKEELGTALVVLPSLAEQKAIAHYLDTKTALIDRKIDLLTQKAKLYGNLKQSLINETVTRGLDKSVPMKDSGVECLGEVPEHWEVKRVKDVGVNSLTNGLFKKKDDFGFGVKLINVSDLYQGNNTIKSEQMDRVNATDDEINRHIVISGDIFFVRSSLKLEGIGISAIIDNVEETTVFECHTIRFRSNKKFVFPKFLKYLFNSHKIKWNFIIVSKTVTMTTISQEKISSVELAAPPLPKQKAIAHYLDTKTALIDQIIQTINTQIEKLKELRKTLINDVVTGKIKVTN